MAELGLALPNHVLPSPGWMWGNGDAPQDVNKQQVKQS